MGGVHNEFLREDPVSLQGGVGDLRGVLLFSFLKLPQSHFRFGRNPHTSLKTAAI